MDSRPAVLTLRSELVVRKPVPSVKAKERRVRACGSDPFIYLLSWSM